MQSQLTSIKSGIGRYATHGFIDFSHVFNVKNSVSNVTWPANASAVTTLHAEQDTPATLHLSWDDRLKIRLNDNELQDLGIHRTYRYRSVKIRLRKGRNLLFVNLDNPDAGLTWGAWTFSCRVVLPNGSVVVPVAPSFDP